MRILSVGRAFPEHYYDQDQLLDALRSHWLKEHFNPQRLERLHKNVLVSGRHLALPLEAYEDLETWGAANDAWIRVAQKVGAEAVRDALDRANVEPEEVRMLMTATVTGVATPSLDALLINQLGLRPDTKRVPIFGLGCVAGAAGIARAADYVKAFPDQIAVFLSVELCSLTVQKGDLSIPNLIATGLFGDGAAAVVIAGREALKRPSMAQLEREKSVPAILDTRSVFYPDTERVMGWDISDRGFQIVLSAEVPDMVHRHLRKDIDGFLAEHQMTRADISTWICHPGGPKVLSAMQEGLELPDGALDLTWNSLRSVGNLSSSSVLMVLRDTLDQGKASPGDLAMLLAMGPGFCSELVLLRW